MPWRRFQRRYEAEQCIWGLQRLTMSVIQNLLVR
jgi:hypothetical protein